MLQQRIPIIPGTLLLTLRPLLGPVASAMLLVAVAQRRNWARVVLLVISAYGLVLDTLNALLVFHRVPVLAAIDIVVAIATAYALCLLFSRESNTWFRRKASAGVWSAGV
jgi:hypothetical protein